MIKIQQFTIILLMALIAAIPARSAPRDKKAMMRSALAVLSDNGHHLSAFSGDIHELRSTSAYTIYGRDNGGFAIIAADDRLPAVLAVSTTELASARSNPGFEWYCTSVEELSRQLPLQGNQLSTTLPDPSMFPSRVDALIQTKWGQDAPFSSWCPTAAGEICDDYRPDVAHCCVGCVATALAQIVNYYRYPAHASATCSFMIGDQGASVYIEGDYDWANMLDDYNDAGYTEAQGRAVAMLSYHCGLISQMSYGTDSSGSSNIMGLKGAQEVFGYSKDAHFAVRNDYDEPSWMNMVYNELSQGRPLYYQGVHMNFNPNDGVVGVAGHSFIIDGYNEQGMVHVNWGWYGNHDGYYDIAILDVRGLNLNAYQDMVLDFVPEQPQGIYGDVDGDGRVSIADVTELINILLEGNTHFPPRADVNGDGHVGIDDVSVIIDLLLMK